MNENDSKQRTIFSPFVRRLFSWQTLRRALIGLACFATLVALFYTEENWRGKRAWDRCKAELEARGVVMDWNAFIPPPVPDDQNIFKAPKMQEWFVGRGQSELSKRLSPQSFPAFAHGRTTNILAELIVIPPDREVQSGEADLILNFSDTVLVIGVAKPESVLTVGAANPEPAETNILPHVEMTDVPLFAAVSNLASRARIRYRFDASLSSGQVGSDGQVLLGRRVAFSWDNVTARQALQALLANYSLMLVPKGDEVLIGFKDPSQEVYRDPEASRQITALVESFEKERAHLTNSASLKSTQGWWWYASPLPTAKNARIYVRADRIPSVAEMAEFFFGNSRAAVDRIRIEPQTDRSFRVYEIPERGYFAGDYLAWSDRFEPEFDQIREALKRPYGRMEGDYHLPYAIPIPNFVTLRVVAQCLVDRAKSHLLLNQPEAAVQDLAFLHDLNRFLEARPTGKPMTLVAAMIKVAIAGLYADTIAEGFKMGAWRESELTALEDQLENTDCLPQVAEAFAQERVAHTQVFEHIPHQGLSDQFFSLSGGRSGFWELLKNPMYLMLHFAPRGWLFQNLITLSTLAQPTIDTYNLSNNLVLPAKALEAQAKIQQLNHRSPFNLIASWSMPNTLKATLTLARNQTQVNEAFVACAVERYRIAHGQYPETLDALRPQFADKIPHDLIGGQPLHYRRTPDGKFLLYSVGWNETDDGGQVVLGSDGKPDREKGDWVWQ